MHDWWPHMGMGGGFMFVWLLLLLVIVAVAAWAVLRVSSSGRSAARPEPEEILRQRYARGEITGEQFEEMRQHLRK